MLQEFLGDVIRHMEGIHMAKVVFDVPPTYARAIEDNKGTASVVVWLKDKSARLAGQQVEGIAALISGALRDIPRQNVRIVDGQGRAYGAKRSDGLSGVVAERHEQELMYEERQAQAIEDLLSYLGDQVKAIVDVKIDFDQKSTRKREVDPDKIAEGTTSIKKESSDPVSSPVVASSTPGGSASLASTASGAKTSKQEKTTVPEFTTTETLLEEAPGKILDISVTVLVPRDGVIEQLKTEGAEIDEKASAQDLAPKLDEIRDCVANGLGVTEPSKVVVKAVSFSKPPAPEPPPEPEMLASLWGTYGSAGVLGLFTLVAMFLLWRMLKRPVEVSLASRGGGMSLGMTDEELLSDLSGPDADTLRKAKIEDKVKEMVVESPQDAAKLITRWVHTEG